MATKRWKLGDIIYKTIGAWTYYGQLIDEPFAVFYRYRTKQPTDDLDAVVASDVLFTIAVHKSVTSKTEWQTLGNRPVKGPRKPKAQAIRRDDGTCDIIDDKGEMRPATLAQCKGLEPAAVWEANHVADRLKDAFAGRPNRWLQQMLRGS